MAELNRVRVVFLPKNTTSRLQSIDAGIITSLKNRYRRRQMERAAELIAIGIIENAYNIDVLYAISIVYDIWDRLECSIIHNRWI